MKSWKGRKNNNPDAKNVKAKRAKRRAKAQPRASGIPNAQRASTKVLRSSKSR